MDNKSTPISSPKSSNTSFKSSSDGTKQEAPEETEGPSVDVPQKVPNNGRNGQLSPRRNRLNGFDSSSTLGSSYDSISSSQGSKEGSLNLKIPRKRLRHDFTPKPYSFKMPGVTCMGLKNARVECPPFHILLDHTIAVIWMLYSPKEPSKELGIVHLQWAISFLQAIRNHNGDNPEDVTMCMRAMQERVIDLYTDMNNFIVPNEVFDSKTTPHIPYSRTKSSEDSYESFKRSLERLKADQEKQTHSKSMTCTEYQYPVSIALKEMLGHHTELLEEVLKPVGSRRPCDGLICPECNSSSIGRATTSTIRAMADITDSSSSLSRTQMLGVLKNWRQEQVERIQEELKRLHSIEEFMFTLNKDNEDLIDDKVVEKIYAYEQKKDPLPKKPD